MEWRPILHPTSKNDNMNDFHYRKLTIVFLILLLAYKLQGQDLLNSRHTSFYTYIYQLTEEEAKNIYKKSIWEVDSTYFHTLVDSFPTDEPEELDLPRGHYLKTFANKGKQEFSIATVQNFDVFVLNNNTDLSIQVLDSVGEIIPDAKVKLKNKNLSFNKKTQTYLDRKSNRRGLLKVTHQGFTVYYDIGRQYNRATITYGKILYKSPLKFVWKPVRYVIKLPIDVVKSIRRGYAQGVIYRTGNFFKRTYEKIACVFDPYMCNYYSESSKKYAGYLVFNKPKYQPGDTVKFNAYIVKKKNGKPLNKDVSVEIGKWGDFTTLTKLSPYRKGAYEYQFYLHDSLKLRLDNRYQIFLQKNDDKEYIRIYKWGIYL